MSDWCAEVVMWVAHLQLERVYIKGLLFNKSTDTCWGQLLFQIVGPVTSVRGLGSVNILPWAGKMFHKVHGIGLCPNFNHKFKTCRSLVKCTGPHFFLPIWRDAHLSYVVCWACKWLRQDHVQSITQRKKLDREWWVLGQLAWVDTLELTIPSCTKNYRSDVKSLKFLGEVIYHSISLVMI